MDNLLFTYYSIGNLTVLIVFIAIAVFFLFRQKKTTLTWIIFFLFAFNANTFFLFAWNYCVLAQIPVLYEYITFVFILASFVCCIQFAYHFPERIYKRESNIVLIITIICCIIIFWKYIFPFHDDAIMRYQSNFRVRPLDNPYGYGISLIILTTWWVGVHLRKAMALYHSTGRSSSGLYNPQRNFARAHRNFFFMAVIMFVTIISLALVMGELLSNTYFSLIYNTASLLAALLFIITYINYSGTATTFMTKLAGITFVFVMVLIGNISLVIMEEKEISYDTARLEETNRIKKDIINNITPGCGKDVVFIVSIPEENSFIHNKDYIFNMDLVYRRHKRFSVNILKEDIAKLRKFYGNASSAYYKSPEEILKLEQQYKKYLQSLQKEPWKGRTLFNYWGFFSEDAGELYIHYDFIHNARIYQVGFSYYEYRKYIHATAVKLIYITLISAFILIVIFPVFFYLNLIKPLHTLLGGVKEVENGELNTVVPVTYKDEIGYLSSSFNRMAQSIKDHTYNLEDMVKERTDELEIANEKLKEHNRLKSNFFANISHEIRTPLTLILSPIESVLLGDSEMETGKEFFETIQRNAIRLLRLVNNLLDFSKIEAGKMTLDIRAVDIVPVIENYMKVIEPAARSKGIALDFIPFDDSINLFVDMKKIDTIFMNILSNALKFTQKSGSINVQITDNDDSCSIEFLDTGVGVPPGKEESIFDRFGQADSSSTRQFEGTGIGLALAKEFIVMHKGTITVKSRHIDEHPQDHGSLFTVTLLKGWKHLEDSKGFEGPGKEPFEEHRFAGMREMNDVAGSVYGSKDEDLPAPTMPAKQASANSILIVEDNSDMRTFLKLLLKDYYALNFAVNGEEGFKAAQHIKPDLIITDVMMPVMNGYDMTKKLKEDSELARIPVIMLTARTEITHKIEGLEYGADDYVTKPFNSRELLTRIRLLLKTYEYQKIIFERNIEIEEELETAKLIEQKLLPQRTPELPGYNPYFLYLPMDKVGGDFYDYTERDTYIDIFIADVSGHGLSAAFLSLITKMALDSIEERTMTNRVLSLLNEVICSYSVKSNYVTAFFCSIDRDTNMLRYSNGGHLPPILFRKEDEQFFELTAKGKPLGWFPNIEMEQKEIPLLPGDRLIFHTDGITECLNRDEQLYGEERFRSFIAKNSHLSPEVFSQKLMDELKEFSGSNKFDDDLTLVLLDII
ncbi:MAG: SpoIIE family protein phosphatase [bacterium]|nr:SpoIIE family protein phosphatase [bacterium]